MKKLMLLIASMFVLTFIWSCTDDNPVSSTQQPNPYDAERRENWEAEAIALMLSGEMVAPQPLYDSVAWELDTIRANADKDSVSAVFIPYYGSWRVGEVALTFHDTMYSMLQSNEYQFWDSLNQLYCLDAIDVYQDYYLNPVLRFKGALNPLHLTDIYATLPGVTRACTISRQLMDGPETFVYQDEYGKRHYFFDRKHGDCPSGCMADDIFYYTVESTGPVYHGRFYTGQGAEHPDWFPLFLEAEKNASRYKCWVLVG